MSTKKQLAEKKFGITNISKSDAFTLCKKLNEARQALTEITYILDTARENLVDKDIEPGFLEMTNGMVEAYWALVGADGAFREEWDRRIEQWTKAHDMLPEEKAEKVIARIEREERPAKRKR